MEQPILYIFNISHYCEKARWALDHFGIAHRAQHVMPGTHRRIARRLGAKRGSVPFLHTVEGVVAGSSAIVDWGESRRGTGAPSLAGEDPALARAIEQRLDDVAGVHVRRFFYSDALFTDPGSVRPLFSNGLPFWQRAVVTMAWSRMVPVMVKGMDLGPAQGLESRAILEEELAWLDGLLADGRPYLAGAQFSRADIAAASLLAPLVGPREHPVYASVVFPAAVSATMREWAQRPIMRMVRKTYAASR